MTDERTTILPTDQTAAQIDALRHLVEEGDVTLVAPCDCGSHIRHNNGGNYHKIAYFRLDAGKCFTRDGSTSEFASYGEWEEVKFSEAVDEIARLASEGWS